MFADDWKSNPQYQQRMAMYQPYVQRAMQQYGLPPEAAEYIQGTLGVESRWGLAKGLDRPGAAGELGIAQLTPAFRQEHGVTNPLDTQQSINAIAQYYAKQLNRGVPLEYVPIGYNAGTGTLNKFLSGQRSFDQLPEITRNYVNRLRQFSGRSSGNYPTGLANFSSPVSRTMNQFGLNAQKQTQPAVDLGSAIFGGGKGSLGHALLNDGGGGVAAPRAPATGWEQDYSRQVPLFQSDASLASINRLLQGV